MTISVLDNPVIGLVEPLADDLECDPLSLRNPHPRVGDEGHTNAVSARNTKDLLFDWAGICIDEDVQQIRIPSFPLLEDYRFVAVNENSVFEMPTHRPCEDAAFEIAALPNQVTHRVAM